jgi:hypothetical protein
MHKNDQGMKTKDQKKEAKKKEKNAPAGNRTRVLTVAGYYSTTRQQVKFMTCWLHNTLLF